MAALICIKIVRGTFCQLVNIANRFLRIFSNLETSIRFIFPGGAGYPYLPTRLIGKPLVGRFNVAAISTRTTNKRVSEATSFSTEPVVQVHIKGLDVVHCLNCLKCPRIFLAPPAERQRSFSNADSSVVRRRRLSSSSVVVVVNFSLKMLISQKLPDNFFSFLVYGFIRKVPMYCINIDLIESS